MPNTYYFGMNQYVVYEDFKIACKSSWAYSNLDNIPSNLKLEPYLMKY